MDLRNHTTVRSSLKAYITTFAAPAATDANKDVTDYHKQKYDFGFLT